MPCNAIVCAEAELALIEVCSVETNDDENGRDETKAHLGIARKKNPEIIRSAEVLRTHILPKDAPPDQRMAVLAAAGAYVRPISMAQRVRMQARARAQAARRSVDLMLVIGWVLLAVAAAIILLMILNYLLPGASAKSAAQPAPKPAQSSASSSSRYLERIDAVSAPFAFVASGTPTIDQNISHRGTSHCA